MLKHLRSAIIVISLLLLFATMWIPSSVAGSRGDKQASSLSSHQNELLAITEIKKYYDAQASWHRFWGGNFGWITDLRDAGLIDPALASGEKFGYIFTFHRTINSATLPGRFYIKARPKVYGRTGTRSFYMNNTCLITGGDKNGEDAGPTDPLLDSCTPTAALDWERYVLNGMRAIANAQFTYQSTTGNGSFGTHDQLMNANLLIRPFGPGDHSWYNTWTVSPSVRRGRSRFKVWVTPFYRETGMRSFFVDETGIVRGADHQGGLATEYDPPIDFSAIGDPAINEHNAFLVTGCMSGVQWSYRLMTQSPSYATLSQLQQGLFFHIPFEVNRFNGYIYTLTLSAGDNDVEPHYEFSAVPEIYGVTGTRSFYVDETTSGLVHGGDKGGASANRNDPPILYF